MLQLNRSNFQAHPFHLVSPSPWPLYTSISLLSLTTSAALSFHGFAFAEYNLMMSLISLILAMAFWWRDVIAEGKLNLNKQKYCIFVYYVPSLNSTMCWNSLLKI
jgi:cytochrome c oxidase subunit 3